MTNRQGQAPDPRQSLPSVSVLLDAPEITALLEQWPRPLVVDAIREALDAYRATLGASDTAPAVSDIVARAQALLFDTYLDRLRPVVNATGIILHTNLGRAVLPKPAVDALASLDGCCNLQIDLDSGKRGKRNFITEKLICRLTGAEAAVIVNNNAAATLLILAALCPGKEVIVSRGQLIEIGGSFRLPDCVHQSGAILVEVGTTNKTHLRDYEQALSENTAAVMRVNPSNYRIVGFSKEVSTSELVTLKNKQPVLVIDDLGCGALVDLRQFGLPHEPTVAESVAAGADVVCFSGDKLIGGPQAGIIVGKKDIIQRIKKHPLTRMLRVGKLTDIALEQTLRLFLEPETLVQNNPTLRMIATPPEVLEDRAQALKQKLDAAGLPHIIGVEEDQSEIGGGSLPTTPLKTYVVAVTSPDYSPDQLSARLRRNEPPVIARIARDKVILDMRTLMEGDEEIVVQALEGIR